MITLYRGDCLEEMQKIADGSIDLTVTSPPYDNLRAYNGNISQWGERVWKACIKDLFRVTKPGGVVVWIVGDATINGSETGTSFKQALWSMECGFNLHDTMIYEKAGIAFPSSNRYYQVFEYMFVFTKGSIATFNQIKDRKNTCAGLWTCGSERQKDGTTKNVKHRKKIIGEYGSRYNIWKCQHVDNIVRRLHPATFPEQLAHDHIISWSSEGNTVLDPFMGSGTTGVACVNTGRSFIGIELDAQYFKIAEERIAKAQTEFSTPEAEVN